MFGRLLSLLVYSRVEVYSWEVQMYDVCVIQNMIQIVHGKP